MNNRSYLRDLAVYFISSVRFLLLKGEISLFVKDLFFFPLWRQYRTSDKGTIHYRTPWLVFSSISYLNKYLKKGMRVFEWGSGGSTLYFAAKTGHIISIEHDSNWYQQAKQSIEGSELAGAVKYTLIEPQPVADETPRNCKHPQHYYSCFTEYAGMQFEAYAKAIDEYPESYFDLIVVDGRVRSSCIAHALQKLKTNGVLLLDNADRSYYLDPFPELSNPLQWKMLSFTGHFPFAPASVLNTTKLFVKR